MTIATTDHPTPATIDVTDTIGALVDAIGVNGVVVLLILAAVLLKSKTVRRWLSRRIRRAIRAALRAAWWALTDYVLILVRHGIVPTWEEQRLLRRISARHWKEHAAARGLGGTLTGRVRLTRAGITAAVRLTGQWTPGKLRSAEDHVRALLGLRTAVRLEIKAGKSGGWAQLTIRTRSAADGVSLTGWEPGAPWGIDTITGEPVMVPLGRRMLIAGTSGAGKSWSTRAILAEASEGPDHRLIVIDRKRVEALNWSHRARCAVTPEEILAVVDELVAEMHERLELVPRGHDVIAISSARPRITVFVDEGGELISTAADKEFARIIEGLRTLARMGRAAEIILVWATQKPTMSGAGHGIDSQIAGQITYRASLALSTAGESRTVFGDDAHEKGWHAHELPMPGVALLRYSPKAKPHPIKTRAFSPGDVIALPDRPVWQRAAAPVSEVPAEVAPALTLVKSAAPEVEQTALPEAILAALTGSTDGRTVAELRQVTGRSQSQVYAALKSLREAGEIRPAGRGRYALATTAAGEVTA